MSTVSLVILISGLAATLLFLAGFWRGVNRAIATRNEPGVTEAPDAASHLGTAVFAVIASAVVITLVGIVPGAIYVGPFLAIFTAAAVGVAFLIER
ncbi:hypothetical protein [Dongia sp.]|uniref:hypothetical protein n=1 Tax=Dongia sp. TaxID=1977262 RepID=UPI0035B3B874